MSEAPPARTGRSGPIAGVLLLGALLLLLPPSRNVRQGDASTAFRWDASELFAALEGVFGQSSDRSQPAAAAAVQILGERGDSLLGSIALSEATPLDALARLADVQFGMAVQGAAHAELLPDVRDFIVGARVRVMRSAVRWRADRATHEALYRVIFGGRIAIEEAVAQAGPRALPALQLIEDIRSEAPSLLVEGVRIHSGDVPLSRGGAPTSALIARGNDFPNAFSHAALAHVDAETGEGTVIESLIEAGTVLHTVEEYLRSQKHRIVVLRLRPDHPALADDALAAHHAAESLLQRLRQEHIAYDFEMNWQDPSAAFCSEIVYHAYRQQGVDLWALRSSMSAPGLVRWLTDMGVRHFTSLVPSDLEYDPGVRAVAEWRDAPAMMDYRLDNAVIDALLEEADRGADLGYAWYQLPGARLLKAISVLQSVTGMSPLIPPGMSAPTALRVRALVEGVHPAVKEALDRRASRFRADRGHEAPYWPLVDLAREAVAEVRPSLAPALSGP